MTVNKTTVLVYGAGLAMVLCLGVAGNQAQAQSTSANECLLIQDNAKRLACFDRLYSAQTKTNAPKVSTEAPAEKGLDDIDKRAQALIRKSNSDSNPFPENPPRELSNSRKADTSDKSFGSELLRSKDEDNVDGISTRIESISTDYRGYATVTLSNEQVWRQTESSRFNLGENDLVRIEKGALGSYYLSIIGNNRQVRVKRIQ
jgi:hypothetical protein